MSSRRMEEVDIDHEIVKAAIRALASSLEEAKDNPRSSIVEGIICPLCGHPCSANIPPLPVNDHSESDGACFHCRGLFKVRRFKDGTIVPVRVDKIEPTPGTTFPMRQLGHKVVVLGIGTALQHEVNIGRVIARLNKAQGVFDFSQGDTIQTLGTPDWGHDGYSFDKLFGYLSRPAGFDYCVGVTTARLEADSFSSVDYENAKIVITLQGTRGFCTRTRRTPEEYLLLSIGAGILYVQYLRNLVQYKGNALNEVTQIALSYGEDDRDLNHVEPKACIFHACSKERGDLGVRLTACQICNSCHGKLEDCNVPKSSIQAMERILASIRRPTLVKSFISILKDPILDFIFGGFFISLLVNLLSSCISSVESHKVIPGKVS